MFDIKLFQLLVVSCYKRVLYSTLWCTLIDSCMGQLDLKDVGGIPTSASYNGPVYIERNAKKSILTVIVRTYTYEWVWDGFNSNTQGKELSLCERCITNDLLPQDFLWHNHRGDHHTADQHAVGDTGRHRRRAPRLLHGGRLWEPGGDLPQERDLVYSSRTLKLSWTSPLSSIVCPLRTPLLPTPVRR